MSWVLRVWVYLLTVRRQGQAHGSNIINAAHSDDTACLKSRIHEDPTQDSRFWYKIDDYIPHPLPSTSSSPSPQPVSAHSPAAHPKTQQRPTRRFGNSQTGLRYAYQISFLIFYSNNMYRTVNCSEEGVAPPHHIFICGEEGDGLEHSSPKCPVQRPVLRFEWRRGFVPLQTPSLAQNVSQRVIPTTTLARQPLTHFPITPLF